MDKELYIQLLKIAKSGSKLDDENKQKKLLTIINIYIYPPLTNNTIAVQNVLLNAYLYFLKKGHKNAANLILEYFNMDSYYYKVIRIYGIL